MTRGINAAHSKIIGDADDTARKGLMLNVPRFGRAVFEADDIEVEVSKCKEKLFLRTGRKSRCEDWRRITK
jgi:hypothetical protein